MYAKLYLLMLFFAGLFAAMVIHSAHNQASEKSSILIFAKVKPGDTLQSIAERSGVSPERIFDANAKISGTDILNVGADIRIPISDENLPNRVMRQDPSQIASAPQAVDVTAVNHLAPVVVSQASAIVTASGDSSVWDRIAKCESGGNWADNTGNGYYGGLQFSLSSWRVVGGSGLPSEASRDEQIARAQMLQAREGWGAWPVCSIKAGV